MATQKDMQLDAQAKMLATFRTFNEIMSGPNPLTRIEIERLIARRPERYGVLRAYLENQK